MCGVIVFNHEDDLEAVSRALYGQTDDELRENAASFRLRLGMPKGAAIWQTVVIGQELGPGFDDYIAHMVGIRLHATLDTRQPAGKEWWYRNRDQYQVVPGDPIEPVGYIFDVPHDPSDPWWRVSIQLWLVRVYHRESPLMLEFLCNPTTGDRIRIVGLEEPHTRDDLDRIYRGMRYIGSLNARGRPLGSGVNISEDDIAQRYWEWTDSRGRPPSQNDPEFADQFYLSTRQFKRRLSALRRSAGFTWPPPRRE